jgi:glycosyltransferase involved in cell wall biosynthesis
VKVLLISDFGIEHTPGGAQRSNEIIIREGERRGHNISKFHYDYTSFPLLDEYDVVISSNLEVISKYYPRLVETIPLLDNHVRLEHDSNTYWNQDFRKFFWSSCKLSFFLTDFHHSFFKEMYGDIFNNVRIIPDPIDRSFRNMNLKRTGKIGYVGYFHYLKGTGNFLNFVNENKQKKFIVAGWGDKEWEDKIRSLQNVEFLGKVNHDDMPTYYNTIASLYYNPICNEPFCRSVGEALMCGTEIVGESKRIGSLEMYKSQPNFKSQCMNAAVNFWKEIECL